MGPRQFLFNFVGPKTRRPRASHVIRPRFQATGREDLSRGFKRWQWPPLGAKPPGGGTA